MWQGREDLLEENLVRGVQVREEAWLGEHRGQERGLFRERDLAKGTDLTMKKKWVKHTWPGQRPGKGKICSGLRTYI